MIVAGPEAGKSPGRRVADVLPRRSRRAARRAAPVVAGHCPAAGSARRCPRRRPPRPRYPGGAPTPPLPWPRSARPSPGPIRSTTFSHPKTAGPGTSRLAPPPDRGLRDRRRGRKLHAADIGAPLPRRGLAPKRRTRALMRARPELPSAGVAAMAEFLRGRVQAGALVRRLHPAHANRDGS
jgi:hypothetical protein